MTRIIAGAARGRALRVPGQGTRPTSDRVREAVFSSLQARNLIDGGAVLDLYAGTGALGLEAVSRGASSAVLVERQPRAAGVIRANAKTVTDACSGKPDVSVVSASVSRYLGSADQIFDIVFLDPPYDLSETALQQDLDSVSALVGVGGVLVVERSRRSPEPLWPAGWSATEKSYGETVVWYASDDAAE